MDLVLSSFSMLYSLVTVFKYSYFIIIIIIIINSKINILITAYLNTREFKWH